MNRLLMLTLGFSFNRIFDGGLGLILVADTTLLVLGEIKALSYREGGRGDTYPDDL